MKKILLMLLIVVTTYCPVTKATGQPYYLSKEKLGNMSNRIIKYTSFNSEENGLYVTFIIPEKYCGDIEIETTLLDDDIDIKTDKINIYMDIINNSKYVYYYVNNSLKINIYKNLNEGNNNFKKNLYYIEPTKVYELDSFFLITRSLKEISLKFNLNSYDNNECFNNLEYDVLPPNTGI